MNNNNKGNRQNNQYQLANRSNKPIIIGIIVLVIVFISAVVWFNFKKNDNLDNSTLNKDNLDNLTMNKIDEKIKSLNELDEEIETFFKEHEDQRKTPEMVQLIAKLYELQTHFQGIQKPDGIYFSEFQRNKIKKMNFYEKEIEELKKCFKNFKEAKPPTIKPKLENDNKSKFKTTQSRFDQVKTYILSETDDKSLLPNNLPQEEKKEIEEIKRSWKNSLSFLKDDQNRIDEKNKTCDDYNRQIQEIKSQYPSLKSQKEQLEQQLEVKNKEINNLKYQRGEISPIYAKTLKKLSNIEIINPKTPNPELETKLKAEISKLQDEVIELVGQISYVKRDIGKLESDQEMYEGMLSNAILLRDSLQRDYDKSKKEYQNQIDSSLNSLYQITSVEE
ncbi:hypothetical protein [Candidatus Phytoplasma solani]|uniref:hypothetical protein n=1 Tax=Candidatus Phytoplasma solani TaxID=69896 RepID=UPI00358F69E5